MKAWTEALGSILHEVALISEIIGELSQTVTTMHVLLEQERSKRMNAEMAKFERLNAQMRIMLQDQKCRNKLQASIHGRKSIASDDTHFAPTGLKPDDVTDWQLNIQIGDRTVSMPWPFAPPPENVLPRGPQDVKKGPRPVSANKKVQISPDDGEMVDEEELQPFSSWIRPQTAVDAMAQTLLYENLEKNQMNGRRSSRRPVSAPVKARNSVAAMEERTVSLQEQSASSLPKEQAKCTHTIAAGNPGEQNTVKENKDCAEGGSVSHLHPSRPLSAGSHVRFSDEVRLKLKHSNNSDGCSSLEANCNSGGGKEASKFVSEATGVRKLVQDEVIKLRKLVSAKSLELQRWEARLEKICTIHAARGPEDNAGAQSLFRDLLQESKFLHSQNCKESKAASAIWRGPEGLPPRPRSAVLPQHMAGETRTPSLPDTSALSNAQREQIAHSRSLLGCRGLGNYTIRTRPESAPSYTSGNDMAVDSAAAVIRHHESQAASSSPQLLKHDVSRMHPASWEQLRKDDLRPQPHSFASYFRDPAPRDTGGFQARRIMRPKSASSSLSSINVHIELGSTDAYAFRPEMTTTGDIAPTKAWITGRRPVSAPPNQNHNDHPKDMLLKDTVTERESKANDYETPSFCWNIDKNKNKEKGLQDNAAENQVSSSIKILPSQSERSFGLSLSREEVIAEEKSGNGQGQATCSDPASSSNLNSTLNPQPLQMTTKHEAGLRSGPPSTCNRLRLSDLQPACTVAASRNVTLKCVAASQLQAAVRRSIARRRMPHAAARLLQSYSRRKVSRLAYLEARVRLRRYLARQQAVAPTAKDRPAA